MTRSEWQHFLIDNVCRLYFRLYLTKSYGRFGTQVIGCLELHSNSSLSTAVIISATTAQHAFFETMGVTETLKAT